MRAEDVKGVDIVAFRRSGKFDLTGTVNANGSKEYLDTVEVNFSHSSVCPISTSFPLALSSLLPASSPPNATPPFFVGWVGWLAWVLCRRADYTSSFPFFLLRFLCSSFICFHG